MIMPSASVVKNYDSSSRNMIERLRKNSLPVLDKGLIRLIESHKESQRLSKR